MSLASFSATHLQIKPSTLTLKKIRLILQITVSLFVEVFFLLPGILSVAYLIDYFIFQILVHHLLCKHHIILGFTQFINCFSCNNFKDISMPTFPLCCFDQPFLFILPLLRMSNVTYELQHLFPNCFCCVASKEQVL